MNAAEGQRTALGRDEGREFALGPVSRVPETLGYEVYGMLLDGLIEGRIRPGDRLIMDRLANELDVSRTPVRDALQRLYREGVIEPAGRRGYLVREQSALDIRDFYLARMAIEGAAAAAIALSEFSAGRRSWPVGRDHRVQAWIDQRVIRCQPAISPRHGRGLRQQLPGGHVRHHLESEQDRSDLPAIRLEWGVRGLPRRP